MDGCYISKPCPPYVECAAGQGGQNKGMYVQITTLPPLHGMCGGSRGAKFRIEEFGGSGNMRPMINEVLSFIRKYDLVLNQHK